MAKYLKIFLLTVFFFNQFLTYSYLNNFQINKNVYTIQIKILLIVVTMSIKQ